MVLTESQEKTAALCEKDKEMVSFGTNENELVYGIKSGENGWSLYYVDEYGWINGEPPEAFFVFETDKRKLNKLYRWRWKIDAEAEEAEKERIKAERKALAKEKRDAKKLLQSKTN